MSRRSGPGSGGALARRAFADARTRTYAFAYLFGVYSWIQPAGYHHAYPTAADRAAFARDFAGNDAIRLFYGYPYQLAGVGGYSAWRVGGTLALAAAAFGMLASVRALRTEEQAGRTELVLAGRVSRRTCFGAAVGAAGAGAGLLWAAETVGFLAGGLPPGGSAYLALGTAAVTAVFIGVGALAAQLAPTRSTALGLGGAAVAVCWLLRVLSDTLSGWAWLRWATPLGWAELMRPFSGPRPAVVALPVVATAGLLLAAGRLSAGRDIGTGLIPVRDRRRPAARLLGSPTGLALRRQIGTVSAWAVGFASFGMVLGSISTGISAAGVSGNLQREVARLGVGSILTPSGYLSFVFMIFVFALCLFACSQIGAARDEESEQRLETLLALPLSRYRWLGGRLMVAALAAAGLAGVAGLLTWVGAAAQGADVTLPRMLEAGANGLPVTVMFLGLGALAYAAAPVAGTTISYTLVTATFLWYLVGSLLGVPGWLTEVSPFRHIGLVPAQPVQAGAAAVMTAAGLAAGGAALLWFRVRDLRSG